MILEFLSDFIEIGNAKEAMQVHLDWACSSEEYVDYAKAQKGF